METKTLIRNKRIEKGLTMKQLAALVGVSEATVSRWESGSIGDMRRGKIPLLAKALGISVQDIMEWPEDEATVTLSRPNLTAIGQEALGPDEYYEYEETRRLAQEIFDDKDLQALFDAARGSRPEDLKMAADLLSRLKETNRDG